MHKIFSVFAVFFPPDPVTFTFSLIFVDHVRSDHHKHNLVHRSHARSRGVTPHLSLSQAACDTSSRNSVW